MGSTISNLFGKKEVRILMAGLDGSGKTCIINMLKLGKTISTEPTPMFNFEKIAYKNITFDIWEVGGEYSNRAKWRHFYPNTEGIIFVVDSSDTERIRIAKEELDKFLKDEELQGVPLLVLANKQDLGVMSVEQVEENLSLKGLTGRDWYIQGCCAVTGVGLFEGLGWFQKIYLKKK